eukprot:SAG25_NODE_11666_length_299_cov_0.510000_1_plen_35_part_01
MGWQVQDQWGVVGGVRPLVALLRVPHGSLRELSAR